ncbi:site-specific integrase [Moritella sp.]|uniref:site-specific integrase n=1 Tax=Moritella sp. TaxID=78556 RepID=UPI001D2E874D|nr:site-specific integrase [Moritella sp.]MCJ8352109.1 site-specific integrase [Moritella sp.]NQZ42215.1 site-specific integrase [Moritella sp.]
MDTAETFDIKEQDGFFDESTKFHEEERLFNKSRGIFPNRQLLHNFVVISVEVPVYPRLKLEITEDGEVKPNFIARHKAKKVDGKKVVFTKKLSMILNLQGVPLLAENLFLHHKMQTTRKYATVQRKADALLAFSRFCYMSDWENDRGIEEPMTYRSLTAEPEYGAPWLFGDWMFDNMHVRDPQTGIVIERGIAPSTAIFNIRTVAEYYGWLITNKMLIIREDYIPYRPEFFQVQKRWKGTSKQQITDKKILAHVLNSPKRNMPRDDDDDITDEETTMIATSDLVLRFTNYANELGVEAHEKLKPMIPSDRLIFESKLKKYEKKPTSLMCKLCSRVGLRVQEVVTFPEFVVRQPKFGEEVITISIGNEMNGCETKFNKTRAIEVPADLMQELYEYKLSDERMNFLEKHDVEVNKDFNQIEHHGRLFVTNREAGSYSKNSLQYFFGEIRAEIIAELEEQIKFTDITSSINPEVAEFHDELNRRRDKAIPLWYYRPHDQRSTFATRWLLTQHEKTGLPFEMLLDELKDLMGHKNIEMTRVYAQFLDTKIIRFNSAARKNAAATLLY